MAKIMMIMNDLHSYNISYIICIDVILLNLFLSKICKYIFNLITKYKQIRTCLH